MEHWKDIVGYEGLYQVSDCGNVRSLNYKGVIGDVRNLKPRTDNRGYKRIAIRNQKGIKQCLVHRLVAGAFLENPQNLPYINHKDENKGNNVVENLEYCTAKYNFHYSIKNYYDKFYHSPKDRSSTRKPYKYMCRVIMTDVDGNVEKIFNTTSEASRYVGTQVCHIIDCCKGKQKTCRGHVFYFEK